jgi:hypothetical protein
VGNPLARFSRPVGDSEQKGELLHVGKEDPRRPDRSRRSVLTNRLREDRLRDNSRVTVDDVCWYVDNPGVFVWEENSKIVGFSAADPRSGNIYALFVEEA